MSKLIKLTSSNTGKAFLINTDLIYKISVPQARDDGKFQSSAAIVEYTYPHATRPNTQAFDFVTQTPDEIAALL